MKTPDPKLFAHLQWKPGMATAQKRIGESGSQGSDDLDSKLTGGRITLPNGLIVSKCSKRELSLPQAVAYATAQNGYLQNADLAMLVRDELDLHPLKKSNRTTALDYSDQSQITSTLCLFHCDATGTICMYTSDLFAMYGNDPAKHQDAAEQIQTGVGLSIYHSLSTLLVHKAGERKAILTGNHSPLSIPCTDLDVHSVSKAIFPAHSQRFADYLQRKTSGLADFWLIASYLPEQLNDPTQCIIRPLRLGGHPDSSISSVSASEDFRGDARARGLAQKYFEATP